MAKGQRTAVITGAVSIVFGVSIAVFISNLLAHDTAWWPSTELLRPFIEAVTSAILPYGLPLAQPGIELATHSLDSQVQRHCVCDQCFVCLCGRCFISSLSNSWTRVAASCSRRRQRLLACDPSRWQRCQRSRVRPAAWTGTSSGLGCRQQRHCWDVLPANARVSAFRWRRSPGQLLSAPQRHDASLLWELRAQHIWRSRISGSILLLVGRIISHNLRGLCSVTFVCRTVEANGAHHRQLQTDKLSQCMYECDRLWTHACASCCAICP